MAKPINPKPEAIERIKAALGCSAAEAEEIARADAAIDHGEPMPFDLTKSQMETAKKYTKVAKKPMILGQSKNKRKENTTKTALVDEISQYLTQNGYESVEITNKSRQIRFKCGEKWYEWTLVEKRS